MEISEVDGKRQWCEFCHKLVKEVEPARLRGQCIKMACTVCLRSFPSKVKHFWGKEQFQYYWDLGKSLLPIAGSGPRRPYCVTLTKEQVVLFRAADYILMEVEDGDPVSVGAEHEEN